MNAQSFYLKPFKTIRFSLHDVELGGTRFTVTVQPRWTKVLLDGKPLAGPVQLPRSHRVANLKFIR